jgi:transposase-like protein
MKTLQDAFAFFADPQNCIATAIKMQWPDGVVKCPTCGAPDAKWMEKRSLFQCKTRHPKNQFSVKVGTIFEDSPIPLDKWFVVTWMLVSCRNGISSYEVARTIGVTQKTAWFMLHRLRKAMQMEHIVLSGTVEADETYVGGKIKNKHTKARKQGKYHDKTPVFGVVERGGMIVAKAVPAATEAAILPVIAQHVENKSKVYTDAAGIYDKVRWMGKSLKHETINHQQDFFKRGRVSTNVIENFWACLKRMLAGTYVSVMPFHLNAYVQEQMFRFNCRFKFVSEEMRFARVLEGTTGRRLTYKQLTTRD